MLDAYLKDCREYLFGQLLPKWSRFGLNHEQGYSYESLSHDWNVRPMGRLRLLTQCRQLYTFSHAYLVTGDAQWQRLLDPLFGFITSRYYLKLDDSAEYRWIFSLNDHLEIKDTYSDCYALAFVLLSFSYYFKATGDTRALELINATHHFLISHMRSTSGGFYERYPKIPEIRRQNPHMHLLEGYLAAYEVTKDAAYRAEIEHILSLLKAHFFDDKHACLLEFFNDDWSPHSDEGHRVEPGHHFEWIWLLHKADALFPEANYIKIADALWQQAITYGFDPRGGIFNQIDAQSGQVIDAEKRIWPMTEYLKALCTHKADDPETINALENTLAFLLSHYFKKDGTWNEYLDAHNQAKAHPLPGTSSYHIFLGLIEVFDWSTMTAS